MLPTDEMAHKGITWLLEIFNGRHCQFTEPYSCRSPQGSMEGTAQDFIWGLLKTQSHLEGGDMVQRIFQAIK